MKKVAILGGNKLAKYISIKLRKNKYKTYYLSRKYKINSSFNKTYKVRNYNFDILKKKLNSIKPKVIINLISFTGDDFLKSIKINTLLPIDILKWSIENKAYLVLIGTAAEYGTSNKKIVSERDKLKPNSVYGYTKSLQSIIVNKYYSLFKNEILLLRIFNLSGDIINKDTIIGKVNNFILKNKNKKNKKILKLGDLSSKRDYIDVSRASNIAANLIFKKKNWNLQSWQWKGNIN